MSSTFSGDDSNDDVAALANPVPRSLPPARHRERPRPPAAANAPASPPPPPNPPVVSASPAEDPSPEPRPRAEPDAKPEKRSYEVGYGKPPVHTRFKPGQSGNPKGRRKNAKGIKTMVRETMTERVPVRTVNGVKKMSRMEATIHKAHELAMKGNVRALAQLITLYSAAVPDMPTESAEAAENLTATDKAMLDALLQAIAGPPPSVPIADHPITSTTPLPAVEAVDGLSDPDEAQGAAARPLPIDMPDTDEDAPPEAEADHDDSRTHVDRDDDEPDQLDCGEPWPPPRRQW